MLRAGAPLAAAFPVVRYASHRWGTTTAEGDFRFPSSSSSSTRSAQRERRSERFGRPENPMVEIGPGLMQFAQAR
eukprot:4350404-Lingulodinium_polyedra.AAC.1